MVLIGKKVIFPRQELAPIEKIYGLAAPPDRGGYIGADAEWEECPNCHKMAFCEEMHWIGGIGYVATKACDKCGYWER